MKKRGLKIWQFILLLIPLILLPIILCFPFYSMDGDTFVKIQEDVIESMREDIKDSDSEYKEEILEELDEKLDGVNIKKELNSALKEIDSEKDLDDYIEDFGDILGIDWTYISGWKLLGLEVDISSDELLEQLHLDESIENAAKGFVAKTVISKVTDKLNDAINDSLQPVRVIAWIMFIVDLVLMLLLVFSFIFHWNKFILTPIVTLYGGVEIFFAAQAIWGLPGSLAAAASKGFGDALETLSGFLEAIPNAKNDLNDVQEYVGIYGKILGKLVGFLYQNMISVGLWMLFSVGLLTVIISVIVMFTGKAPKVVVVDDLEEEQGQGQGGPGKMAAPPVTGMFCLKGSIEGADIPLDQNPIVVGRSPQECQIVLTNPKVSHRHFSVYYDKGNQVYVLECHSGQGLMIQSAEYGEVKMSQGMSYTLKPKTQIRIAGDEEIFLLK